MCVWNNSNIGQKIGNRRVAWVKASEGEREKKGGGSYGCITLATADRKQQESFFCFTDLYINNPGCDIRTKLSNVYDCERWSLHAELVIGYLNTRQGWYLKDACFWHAGTGYGGETCAEPLKNGKIQGEEGFGKGTNNWIKKYFGQYVQKMCAAFPPFLCASRAGSLNNMICHLKPEAAPHWWNK